MSREARPWDLFKRSTEYVSDDVQETRYSICESCEYFLKVTRQCRKCGCLMHIKTTMAHAECPIGKWGAETSE